MSSYICPECDTKISSLSFIANGGRDKVIEQHKELHKQMQYNRIMFMLLDSGIDIEDAKEMIRLADEE